MLRLIFPLILCLAVSGQPRATHVLISARTGVTADKVTVAQSTTQPTLVQPISAVIQSTVGGTVVVEHSGAAPTTTAQTPVPTQPGGDACLARGFVNSNVGAGTAASITYTLTAGVPLVLDMTTMNFSGSGATKNITVNVALVSSGNVQTAFYFREGY
jgi:hypothetical protein